VHLVKDVLERRRLRLRDDVVTVDADRLHATQEPARTTGDEDISGNSGGELRKPRARSAQIRVVELEVYAGLGIEHAHVRLDERGDVLARSRARITHGLGRARAKSRR
jgi:hypothetical protein